MKKNNSKCSNRCSLNVVKNVDLRRIFNMIKGKLSARAVALQDLVSDMKVLDKKEISLGLIQLGINEQTNRTLEQEIEQKHKAVIEKANKAGATKTYQKTVDEPEKKNEEEEDKEQEQEQEKSIDDGANDLII